MTYLTDPDCPDCRTRRHTYQLFGNAICLRCTARHISREPPALAAYYGERLRKQLTREEHDELVRMIAEERRADAAEFHRQPVVPLTSAG